MPTKGSRKTQSDGESRTAIRVALIGGGFAIVAAVIGILPAVTGGGPDDGPDAPPGGPTGPAKMPPPDCPTCQVGGRTFPEQAGPSGDKPTYRDPRAFKGSGQKVQSGQQVDVVCRFLDPDAPSSVQPGWWYLIASPPWNRQYYTAANSYLNGDPPEGPHQTDFDNGVPEC